VKPLGAGQLSGTERNPDRRDQGGPAGGGAEGQGRGAAATFFTRRPNPS
jgi:hypothetical protein